jgi:hypothetical protein
LTASARWFLSIPVFLNINQTFMDIREKFFFSGKKTTKEIIIFSSPNFYFSRKWKTFSQHIFNFIFSGKTWHLGIISLDFSPKVFLESKIFGFLHLWIPDKTKEKLIQGESKECEKPQSCFLRFKMFWRLLQVRIGCWCENFHENFNKFLPSSFSTEIKSYFIPLFISVITPNCSQTFLKTFTLLGKVKGGKLLKNYLKYFVKYNLETMEVTRY